MSDERLPEDPEALEALKLSSTAQLLMKCARLVNERALSRLRAQGLDGVRATHTALLPHIDLEGTRLSELARRVGVSKQAVGQWVDELEAMGGLTRAPDPHDKRARLVRFVPGALTRGLGELVAMEQALSAQVGAQTMATLHESLRALHDALMREGEAPEQSANADDAPR